MGCQLSALLADDGTGVSRQDLPQVSERDALRMLRSYEQPITLQIEGWKGKQHQLRQTSDCSTQTERNWDALQNLGVTLSSASRLSRPCCNHIPVSHDHYRASEYFHTISMDRDSTHRLAFQDAGLPSYIPKEQSCLIGCCSANTDEPSSFLSQTEDDDLVMEKPLGYLPLLHELDSGLGCTDGSFHQGELSGVETEDGVEEPVSTPPEPRSHAGSPSSESLISSELSDSGFYSVGTGEFHHFQRLLEKKLRLYRARGVPREQREGLKACWDLESIPEVLTCQPQISQAPDSRSTRGPRCSMGVSSVQVRRAESPRLNICNSGSVFSPLPGPSSCSTPSYQRRGMLRHQNSSVEFLHQSDPLIMDRRRASHPASPNYSRAVGHQQRELSIDFPERRQLLQTSSTTESQPHSPKGDRQDFLPREPCCKEDDGDEQERVFSKENLWKGRDRQGDRDLPCHTLQCPQYVRETWPKFVSYGGQKGAPYSTLDGNSMGSGKSPSGHSRAARNQLLKARASRLADELSEVTTDEDTRGEVKTGRYWSKAERRRHLLLAREQRQRRLARSREGRVRGGARSGVGCTTVLELSQRKLTRLRNRKLLDDWTTVEELLTHGTRLGNREDILHPSTLLSVTTV